jgi:prolyl oligopeptidase
VQAWSNAQNAYARAVLDALPERDAIRRRISELLHASPTDVSAVTVRGGRVFAVKRDPAKEQTFLVTLDARDASASQRVVVDPTAGDLPVGTSIDWYVASPNATLVAVSLSQGGSERGDVHVFETATGKPTGEVVPRVHNGTAGGSLASAMDIPGRKRLPRIATETKTRHHDGRCSSG